MRKLATVMLLLFSLSLMLALPAFAQPSPGNMHRNGPNQTDGNGTMTTNMTGTPTPTYRPFTTTVDDTANRVTSRTNAVTNRSVRAMDTATNKNNAAWGWLGLLGLFGLIGMRGMGRSRGDAR